MSTVGSIVQAHQVSMRLDSPVGRLTLVATDAGLAAVLWENDRPHRVRLNVDAENETHPVLVEAALWTFR